MNTLSSARFITAFSSTAFCLLFLLVVVGLSPLSAIAADTPQASPVASSAENGITNPESKAPGKPKPMGHKPKTKKEKHSAPGKAKKLDPPSIKLASPGDHS